MERIKEIDLINDEEKYLIDYSNLKNNLIINQDDFLGNKDIEKYYNNISYGMPILLPLGIKNFDYSNVSDEFRINVEIFARKIFLTDNINYVGVQKYFKYGDTFCTGAKPKPEFNKIINKFSNINENLKKIVKSYIKENKKIIAFQTRNIPHLGHEKIIETLLGKFDYVIVNPVIGPKKIGDVKNEVLSKVFQYLSNEYYNGRIIFAPMCANMFYAGPREAIHHAFLRKNIGFSSFVVGRDHAGAENNFGPEDAINTVRLVENEIGMDIITHMGSYYNNSKKEIVIKDHLNKEDELLDISGTEFRECIKKKKLFKHARKELQDFLLSYKGDLFY